MLSIFFIVSMLFGEIQSWSFEDFPVENCEPFERVQRLSRDSLPDNSYIMEAFDAQWKHGGNIFACHYYVLSFGCGDRCQMNLIFDQRTGECIRVLITSSGVSYRHDSRVLVAFIDRTISGRKQHFLMTDGELRQFDPFMAKYGDE